MMISIGLMLSLTPAAAAQEPVLPAAAPVIALWGDEDDPETPMPSAGGRWNLVVTPYLWAPEIDVNDGELELSFSDILDDLQAVVMFTTNGRKDGTPWGFTTDTLLLELKDTPDGVDVKLRSAMIGIYATYALDTKYPVDLIGGVRYWNLNLDVGPFGDDVDWIDPVLGARTQIPIKDRWSANVYGDFGGFGLGSTTSHFTWQGLGLINYEFNRILTASLGYRYFYVNYEGSADAKLEIHGPIAGLRITL